MLQRASQVKEFTVFYYEIHLPNPGLIFISLYLEVLPA
jgi:hypothetical protein